MNATNMSAGDWLREKRKKALLGLRKFSLLIGDLPSNVCNIENGNRQPWQNEAKLRKVAEVLGIRENSEDWDTLFGIVKRPNQPPADLISYMNHPLVPTLLRTIGEYQLSEDDLQKVLKYVKTKFGKGRKDGDDR